MKAETRPHGLEFRQSVLEIRRPGLQAVGFVFGGLGGALGAPFRGCLGGGGRVGVGHDGGGDERARRFGCWVSWRVAVINAEGSMGLYSICPPRQQARLLHGRCGGHAVLTRAR